MIYRKFMERALSEERKLDEGDANESYQKNMKVAMGMVKDIDKLLKGHGKKQKLDPTNWGFVGDLDYVVTELNSLRKRLSGK